MQVFATNEGVQPEAERVTLACDRSLDEGEAVIRATFDPGIGSTGREFFVQIDPTEADVLLALIEVAGDCGGDEDAAEVVERFRERVERVRKYRDDPKLAEALVEAAQRYAGGEEGSDIPLAEAESAILDRLDISGDETEQGLTRKAVRQIEAFVSDARGRPWDYQDSGLLGIDGVTEAVHGIDRPDAEQRRYRICETYARDWSGPTIEADSPRDALANYAVAEGFADPRELDEEESGLYEHEGQWHMTFTNTDLVAVEEAGR